MQQSLPSSILRLRSDASFDHFYTKVVEDSKDLTSPPVLPRYRQPPRRPGTEGAAGHAFSSPESYFRKEYFEVLDMLANELNAGSSRNVVCLWQQ